MEVWCAEEQLVLNFRKPDATAACNPTACVRGGTAVKLGRNVHALRMLKMPPLIWYETPCRPYAEDVAEKFVRRRIATL